MEGVAGGHLIVPLGAPMCSDRHPYVLSPSLVLQYRLVHRGGSSEDLVGRLRIEQAPTKDVCEVANLCNRCRRADSLEQTVQVVTTGLCSFGQGRLVSI